jgi:hypothetical protein
VGTLGHKKVELAAEVYDRASSTDIGQALHVVGKQLQPHLCTGFERMERG